MPGSDLSIAEARRIAIAAQGLHEPSNSARIDRRHIRRAIRSIGLLQLDFVNVLVPAHHFVVYSRVGPYSAATLQRALYDSGEYTEQWAHEASVVPMSAWPLLAYRRRAYKPWTRSPLHTLRNKTKYLDQIIDFVEKTGAVTSQDLEPVPTPRRKPGDWHRSIQRCALEYHFGSGSLAVKKRLPNFQRVYDLPERVIPQESLQRRVEIPEAHRELLLTAVNAYGVATLSDLADYYRMTQREAKPRVMELVDAGLVREVRVEGWSETAFLSAAARLPRCVRRSTLVSPFDPLVWFRPRAERLFGFRYRIEIYVPAAKRKWGYYVLPFLMNDTLAARVDLKADRQNSELLVAAAHREQGADEQATAGALAEELKRVASWLKLGRVRVGRKGGLSQPLRKALG